MNNKKVIYSVLGLFTAIFLLLAGYMAYFTAFESQSIVMHPSNRRLDHLENEVIRGSIYDNNGNILAETQDGVRTYPYGSRYAHIVGYTGVGKYGIEALSNVELLYPDYNIKSIFENTFTGKKFEGRNVVLTLDDRLQKASAEALEGYKGAVVILEPSTGKIKAMYSNPTFNPNKLVANWDSLTSDDKNSPLVNRATQGLYPPGSIFKIIPAIALIESNPNYMDISYYCNGKISKDDYTIQCYDGVAHGEVTLKEAFEKSCNAYFIHLEDYVSPKVLQQTGEKLLFNQLLPVDVEYNKSRLLLGTNNTNFDISATYIGQGKTLVTPLHMAMIASAIANDGVLMAPYVFDYSANQNGRVLMKNLPEYYKALMDENVAKELQKLMTGVVDRGTATRLAMSGIEIAGKTGTAQNETGQDHSWFMGFAYKTDNPDEEIAFAVIVENGGNGSKALEVTKEFLKTFKNLD